MWKAWLSREVNELHNKCAFLAKDVITKSCLPFFGDSNMHVATALKHGCSNASFYRRVRKRDVTADGLWGFVRLSLMM